MFVLNGCVQERAAADRKNTHCFLLFFLNIVSPFLATLSYRHIGKQGNGGQACSGHFLHPLTLVEKSQQKS